MQKASRCAPCLTRARSRARVSRDRPRQGMVGNPFMTRNPFLAACAFALFACSSNPKRPETPMTAAYDGPLIAKWQGPWGGVPPFGQFKPAEIKPAMERAMADNLADMDRIASNPEAATFENTITAMERAGGELDRASA